MSAVHEARGAAAPDAFCRDLGETVAAAGGRRLRPRGSASKAALVDWQGVEALPLAGYHGICDYAPSELVLTARAGTRIADIDAAAAGAGQMLPFEPAAGHGATLGGTLAAGLAGPRGGFAGGVRDAVLGVACVNGRGEHLRFGGRVIKNVAGFDLGRLLVGSMGSLAVITEASVRLVPRPEREITLCRPLSAADCIAAMRALAREPWPVTASCWHDGLWRIRLGGVAEAVDAAARALGGDIDTGGEVFWARLRELDPPVAPGGALWRLQCRPARPLPAFPGEWLVDAAGALRWLRTEASAESVRAMAAGEGAQLRALRGAPPCCSVDASTAGLRERIKRAFDPHERFARLGANAAC